MKKSLTLALAVVASASISWASIALNSSRSNVYRVIYSADIMSQAQATAMLAGLDGSGLVDEARLQSWLLANFKKYGVQGDKVTKIVIQSTKGNTSDRTTPKVTIILVTNSAEEAQARLIAVSDSGTVSKPTPVVIKH